LAAGPVTMRVAFFRVGSLVALVALPGLIVACGSNRGDSDAVTGSVAPAKTVIVGIGSNAAGGRLDGPDRQTAAAAEFRALEYGRSGMAVEWAGPQRRGSIVPGKPYPVGNEYCRAYTITVYAGRSPETAKSKACRSPEGTWRSVG
jgi:surface antigen